MTSPQITAWLSQEITKANTEQQLMTVLRNVAANRHHLNLHARNQLRYRISAKLEHYGKTH